VRYDGRAHFKCQFRLCSKSVAGVRYLVAPQRQIASTKCLAENLDSSACKVMLPPRHTSEGSGALSQLGVL
jgi:hypothetical protein